MNAKKLVEHLWGMRNSEILPYREQRALNTLMHPSTAGDFYLAGATVWAKQEQLNGYPKPNACSGLGSRNWERGDFVAHFPGCSKPVGKAEGREDVRNGPYGERLDWTCEKWAAFLLKETIGGTGSSRGWDKDTLEKMPEGAKEKGFVEMGGEEDGDWAEREREWKARTEAH